MGARKSRSLGRGVSRTLLLLLVALVAAIAVPGGQAGAAKKAPPGDPPGNNGTVKVSRTDPADDPNYDEKKNEPIGENCYFWLRFFDFDQGQLADIAFAAHPPTGGKAATVDRGGQKLDDPGKGREISDDPAGGGQDEDLVYGYNLTDYVRDLTRHEQHGYHIKLTVTIKDSKGDPVPGGVKHKVFWIDCTPPPAEETPTTQAASTLRIAKAQEGAGEGPFAFELNCTHSPLNGTFTLNAGEKRDFSDVPPGTTCEIIETDTKNAQSTTITEDPPHGKADDGTVKTGADKSTIVTFKNKFQGTEVVAPPPNEDIRPPAGTPAGSGGNPGTSVGGTNTSTNPGASVLGATETAPEAAATLPRTGSDPWPMTATGLSALAAGAALLAGGRRRRA